MEETLELQTSLLPSVYVRSMRTSSRSDQPALAPFVSAMVVEMHELAVLLN